MKSNDSVMPASRRCRWRQVSVVAWLYIFWVVVVPPAGAQNASGPGVRVPMLGGHRFQSLATVGSPFVRTSVRNGTSLGKAIDLETPLYDFLGDPVGKLKGDLLFLGVDFEYMHAVKDWLGLWFRFKALGRLGTNEQSLLAEGVTTLTSMEMGWLFKLYENEKWFFSGTLNLWNSDLLRINLLKWVDQIIDDGGISPNNRLVEKTPSLRGGFGVRAAYAPNALLGLTGLVETGIGESLERRRENDVFLNFGLGGDIDLLARTAVPIGFAVAYYLSTFPELGDSSTRRTDTLVSRINFTGRDDFLVGIESVNTRTKIPAIDGTINSSLVSLQLHYYF